MADKTANVRYDEECIVNRRGLKLFTCRWLPRNQEPKGLVFLCHGYAMECSISMKGTATTLAEAGLAVHGIDYEGHGKSSGLQGYVSSFDQVVGDCCDFFATVAEERKQEEDEVSAGESMGGAVALLVHKRQPFFWDGAILVAPMCKIADDMKPNALLISISEKLCKFIPTWKIVPTKNIINVAIKEPKRREEVRSNRYCYKGRPRLKTGHELLKISLQVEKSLHEVSLPFLIVHGQEDQVTDPSVSRLLYESASSSDKALRLYPGMWHALTSGEPPENIDLVFSDIINWLDKQIKQGSPRLDESEHKMGYGALESNLLAPRLTLSLAGSLSLKGR